MEHYLLQPNEVLLFEGIAYRKNTKNIKCKVLLTNLFLVYIITSKKLFAKQEVHVDSFPISDIKIYNDIPQIKQTGSIIEIYFLHNEEKLDFIEKREARKFINTAYELVTGKTFAKRGADKFKGAVKLVDDTLGISAVNTVKGVLENGIVGSVVGGIKHRKSEKQKLSAIAGDTIDVIKERLIEKDPQSDIQTPEPQEAPNNVTGDSLNDKIAALKELKELLDANIITQEEFEAKKAELLARI